MFKFNPQTDDIEEFVRNVQETATQLNYGNEAVANMIKIALCGLRWFKLNVSKYQKRLSSCQKDVKLSKRCQMSKNETPRLWRRFTKKLNLAQ